MFHRGQIALDVTGEERRKMSVGDLLALFKRDRGEELSDDALLLGQEVRYPYECRFEHGMKRAPGPEPMRLIQ